MPNMVKEDTMATAVEAPSMAGVLREQEDEFPALIAQLYELWTLDCLNEIGYAVAVDFITRPQLYLSDDIPDDIVRLRMAYGTDVPFPNAAQRQAMMMPVFGRSDGLKPDASTGTASFHMARKKFLDACIAFAERAVDTGLTMLEERVRSALVPLRAHFEALRGKSLQLTATQQMQALSDTVTSILRAPGVARVFSVSPAEAGWPFGSDDPNGAKLVENAGAVLPLPPECKLSYTKFILLQRVAREGEQALSLVFTDNPTSEELPVVVSAGYSWAKSLHDFQQMP
jgi:hypothetical protein